MFGKLLLLFIVVPLVDLALLLMLADLLTWQATLAIVVLSGILGAALASWQGRLARGRIEQRLQQGLLPTSGQITDGAMILFAAGLLITPGLLTDLFGLSLLIPAARNFYRKLIKRWFQSRVEVHTWTSGEWSAGPGSGSGVVEGEVVSRDEADEGIEAGGRASRGGASSPESET